MVGSDTGSDSKLELFGLLESFLVQVSWMEPVEERVSI